NEIILIDGYGKVLRFNSNGDLQQIRDLLCSVEEFRWRRSWRLSPTASCSGRSTANRIGRSCSCGSIQTSRLTPPFNGGFQSSAEFILPLSSTCERTLLFED